MTTQENLLEPPETRLPENTAAQTELDEGKAANEVAARHPTHSAAWARLAELALESGESVAAYAYARTGYHRGLDSLRKAGWKGFGPVPWSHRPNQGVLRSVAMLAKAAGAIGEEDEYDRCRQLLLDSDPAALEANGMS